MITHDHKTRKHASPLPGNPPLRSLILALALSGCAISKVKGSVRISERIILEEGYRIGTLRYAGDELKLAKEDEKSLLFRLNPGDRDTNLSALAGRKTKRLYFKNKAGSKVYLMRILHGGRTIQECDEPEIHESLVKSGGGYALMGPGPGLAYMGPGKEELVATVVHDIRCILNRVPDTVGVELMDPDGLYARYRVILKD